MKFWLSATFLFFGVCGIALAQEAGPVIKALSFQGMLRFDEETARYIVSSKVGQVLDEETVSKDIKALYKTGAFEQIEAYKKEVEGGVELVFLVKERPAIDKVIIEGANKIKEDDIRKKITIRKGQIVNVTRVERSVEAIREHYMSEGYYMAEVGYRLKEKPDNLVDVVFVIRENEKVKIQRIEFVGNESIPDDELKNIMMSKEYNLFGFATGAGQFSREMLDADLQNIRFYYGTKGFAEATVEEPVIMVSADRRYIVISITIHEGNKYTMGKVDIAGDFLFPKETLLEKVKAKTGQIFNALDVQTDIRTLGDLYKDEGYAFATVSAIPTIHREEKILDLTYVLQKGEKARFGRIEITGNEQTRDWTIRRELRIFEGDFYSETKLRESEARVKRLGFFEKVEVKTKPSERAGEVDVIVEVQERKTGSFMVGAGVSSLENFMFQAQVSKQNFMGRGQSLSLLAMFSSLRTIYQFSFDEPYLFDTNWTFAMDIYNYEYLYYNFSKKTRGFDLTFGRRFTDNFGASTSYKVEGVEVSTGGQRSVTEIPVANLYKSGLLSSLTLTFWLDTLDDRLFPTRGNYSSVSAEWSGSAIGSAFPYLRFMVRSRQYFPFILGSVLKIAGTYGHIINPEKGDVPLGERFYVGGIFSVRGFERFSLGPRLQVGAARDPAAMLQSFTIGGNKELYFNVEVEFPIFMQAGIRGVVFFDAGNAFDDHEVVDIFKLRTSMGFGIRWWSPMGPLRFEWGFPLRPKDGEPPMVFEFTIGSF